MTPDEMQKLLDEKDQKIKELMANQKSIDLDIHNLTEQLFEQAYKLVNDEKKRSAELKVRIEMLEAENNALKSTIKAHKRPTFSHRVLSPTSLMTPVKLSKTPFRKLLSRYSNNSTTNNYAITDKCPDIVFMEPLVSDKEPSTPEKSICEQQAPFQQQIVSSVVASLINEVTETGEMENMEKFKENQTKLINALREQEVCNQKLRSYIDNILSRVIEIYPEILEIDSGETIR